jgi:hypothetical protein
MLFCSIYLNAYVYIQDRSVCGLALASSKQAVSISGFRHRYRDEYGYECRYEYRCVRMDVDMGIGIGLDIACTCA